MKKYFLLIVLLLGVAVQAIAQKAQLIGTVQDATTGETLPEAGVKTNGGGTTTDFDGNYTLNLPAGTYELTATYVGYMPQTVSITLTAGQTQSLNFKLQSDVKMMQEVEVVADVARSRVTPVAFSTITANTVVEQLGNQDLPMVFNSTPGMYATQQGGGDGDARVTIRGFNQRNIAIMIDGVPVNDMENGWVYWSNWSGLQDVMRSMQVQRGLGASKLALPSVGGTINVLSRGIDAKSFFRFQQDVSSGNTFKTSIAGGTGRLKGNWGMTFAFSHKRGDGLVDATWTNAYFYFLKVEKQFKNHLIGVSAVGAPQQHGQRVFKQRIARYDKQYAYDLGVDTSSITSGSIGLNTAEAWDLGIYYNSHWGYADPTPSRDSSNAIVYNPSQVKNEAVNYYHKPQFMVKDFWVVNDKLSWSNILYASIGNGGGTSIRGATFTERTADELWDYEKMYVKNQTSLTGKASYFIRSSVNSHRWYGALSTFDYKPTKTLSISGGLDARYYKGIHYQVLTDLLGGQFYQPAMNTTTTGSTLPVAGEQSYLEPNNIKKYENDTVNRNYIGLVKWGGLFGQVEYQKGKISTFLNVTSAMTGYQRIDYYRPKDLVLADTTIRQVLGAYDHSSAGANGTQLVYDTLVYNGQSYTMYSPEAKTSTTDQVWISGYTFKTGLNYNIDRHHNVFFNTGYLLKAPGFDFVFARTNVAYPNYVKEKILSGELGYGYKNKTFAANVNAYYTAWINRPLIASVQRIDPQSGEVIETVNYNVQGLKAHHRGVEIDFAYNISRRLKLEGLVSVGDWIWKTDSTANFINEQESIEAAQRFSANGVHVGDAAQMQYGLFLRYEPIKNLYASLRWSYFGKNFSDFAPEQLIGANRDREMWRMPDYQLWDLNFGYKVNAGNGYVRFGGVVQNLFNTRYISDASTRGGFATVDENGNEHPDLIEVFFGMGRRYNLSLEIGF